MNQVCRNLLNDLEFFEKMEYGRKTHIYEQLCSAQGINLVARSQSALAKLIEFLANNLRENIHKIEERGVFDILKAAQHMDY